MLILSDIIKKNLVNDIFAKPLPIPPITGDLEKLEVSEEEIDLVIKESYMSTPASKKKKRHDKIQSIDLNQNNRNINQNSKKFKITTNANSIIKLPSNYSTDVEDEKKIVDMINDQSTEGWEEARNKNNVIVYKKTIEGTNALMFKSKATIPFPFDIVYEAMTNIELRKKWDKGVSKLEVLHTEDHGDYISEVSYSYMKLPFIVGDRDWVKLTKIWKNYAGKEKTALMHFKSTQHEKYPEKKSPIRGEFLMNGIYFEEVNGVCNLIMINHADIKPTSMMISIINSKAPDSPLNFGLNLMKGCKLVKN